MTTGTATTDASGLATFKYRIGRKDPLGVYEADAHVTSRSAATNFTVE